MRWNTSAGCTSRSRKRAICFESRPNDETSTQGVSLFVFGIRSIDDIVMRQRDANVSGPPDERRYYLTDANYNVAMIVTDAGYGVERVFYTAYGEPEVFPFADVDGDYDVQDPSDKNAMIAIKDGQAPYNILADLNLDGAVTQADVNAFSAYSGALGGQGVLTASNGSATTGNDVGYAGYIWNDERSQWHVRYREHDPKLGRWLQRDPLPYFDGVNTFEYGLGNAAGAKDPLGLSSFLHPEAPIEVAICSIGLDVPTGIMIRKLCEMGFSVAMIAAALMITEECVDCAGRLAPLTDPSPDQTQPGDPGPTTNPVPRTPRFRPKTRPTPEPDPGPWFRRPLPRIDPIPPLWRGPETCDPQPRPIPDHFQPDLPAHPDGPSDGPRSRRCRCSKRFTDGEEPPSHCPGRVYYTVPNGTSIGKCQEAAKLTAPPECRKFYAHCSFIP